MNLNEMEITDPGKFEEIINSFESSANKINEIIDKEKKNVEKVNQTSTWSGTAAETMYEKYKLLNSNYDQISYSLDLYVKFLRKTLEEYSNLIKEMNKNIDEVATRLEVNTNN